MELQNPDQKTISPKKKALRKNGGIYSLVFIVCLLATIIMHSSGIQGGIIFGLLSLALLVFLILAIITLIRGYSGK